MYDMCVILLVLYFKCSHRYHPLLCIYAKFPKFKTAFNRQRVNPKHITFLPLNWCYSEYQIL